MSNRQFWTGAISAKRKWEFHNTSGFRKGWRTKYLIEFQGLMWNLHLFSNRIPILVAALKLVKAQYNICYKYYLWVIKVIFGKQYCIIDIWMKILIVNICFCFVLPSLVEIARFRYKWLELITSVNKHKFAVYIRQFTPEHEIQMIAEQVVCSLSVLESVSLIPI